MKGQYKMIIDFHTHAFPDKIAPKAIESLKNASALEPYTDGTIDGLKKSMEKDGVDISVVLGIATNTHQQKAVNDFLIQQNKDDKIITFGSVHPDAPDALEELERIKEAGLKGVKFHPEYQSFYVDDEKMRPIYKKISDLGLITIFHAGYDYGYPPPYHAMPENLFNALKWFSSPVVAAHWGGQNCGEGVIEKLCSLPIYFDISFGYGTIAKPTAVKIIEKHGTDKLLFGSDSPWHRPKHEKALVNLLSLSDEEKDKIFYKNAQKLLNI